MERRGPEPATSTQEQGLQETVRIHWLLSVSMTVHALPQEPGGTHLSILPPVSQALPCGDIYPVLVFS